MFNKNKRMRLLKKTPWTLIHRSVFFKRKKKRGLKRTFHDHRNLYFIHNYLAVLFALKIGEGFSNLISCITVITQWNWTYSAWNVTVTKAQVDTNTKAIVNRRRDHLPSSKSHPVGLIELD